MFVQRLSEASSERAGSCQCVSKCTEQTTVCQLINAAACQDQEKSRLLFPQLLET